MNQINFEYQTETEKITQNKIYNSVKQIIIVHELINKKPLEYIGNKPPKLV